MAQAKDLLRELIALPMSEGGDLPSPSRPDRLQTVVVPPVSIALEAAFYETIRETGMSQRILARDLWMAESEVRLMPNPDNATRTDTIDLVLRRLGKRGPATFGEAA